MNVLPAAIILWALCASPSFADLPAAPKPLEGSLLEAEPIDLSGRWVASLHHGKDTEDTAEDLTISSASGINLQGGFLGNPFIDSRVTRHGDATVFFATTDDGSGPIQHSGRLEAGVIKGQSYFTGRNTLLPWIARRATD